MSRKGATFYVDKDPHAADQGRLERMWRIGLCKGTGEKRQVRGKKEAIKDTPGTEARRGEKTPGKGGRVVGKM